MKGFQSGLEPWQRVRTFEEDQRRYWTNRILREKGVLSPETIFKKIKPANDTYQVWEYMIYIIYPVVK